MKVLIVEDERRAARAIGRMVNQHPLFSVAGMVLNGREALDFLETTPVDLIITDIRMPVMGGTELMEALHERGNPPLFAVLSGYSTFDYARSAIQNQAFDYLLKPVNQEAIFTLLDKAADHLNAKEQGDLCSNIRKLLTGEPVPGGMPQLCAALVRTGIQPVQDDFRDHPDQAEWLEQAFDEAGCLFYGASDNEYLLILHSDRPFRQQAEVYFSSASEICDMPMHMIYSSTPTDAENLLALIGQLREDLAARSRLFTSELLALRHDVPDAMTIGSPLKDMHPERAAEAICAQDRPSLLLALREMLDAADEYGSLTVDVQSCLRAILNDSRIVYQLPSSVRNAAQRSMDDLPDEARTPEQFVETVADFFLSLPREQTAVPDAHDLAEEIAEELEANYHRPFSAEPFLHRYKLSAAALNKLFRHHKGMRPAEYLQKLRMEKAKQLLETMPDALIKDIAAQVGYPDPHYFSKVFHQATGLWPTEYQKQK